MKVRRINKTSSNSVVGQIVDLPDAIAKSLIKKGDFESISKRKPKKAKK